MKKSPTLSVIVPVYNVERYLNRCIQSILKQDFTDYELILIDDGSTDSSGKICDQYSKKYDFVQTVHKKNSSASEARNTGLDHAIGDYVVFIDSDDYIELGMFQSMINKCIERQADICSCQHSDDYGERKIVRTEFVEFLCTGKEALKYMLQGKLIAGSSCAKIIRRSAIGDLRFINGKNYEDAMFNTDLFLKVNRVIGLSEPYYVYFHRENSLTTEKYTDKAFDVVYAYEYIKKRILKNTPCLLDVANFRILWAHCVVYDRMILSGDYKNIEEYLELKKYLKSNASKIISCPFFSKGRKLSMIIFKINAKWYHSIVRLQNNKRGINA